MAEITKELLTALYQRSGEKLYKLLLETIAKQVVLEDGTTVQEAVETIQNVLSQNTTTYVVQDIEAMEALENVIVGDSCWVIDASADETVDSGAAKYIYQSEEDGWVKVSEAESMDVVVNWDDVQEKPDVLDRLGVDEDGNLTLDGEEVGSGESGSKPWTAYGDGVDAAPEGLRDAGVYVSDEAEAPEETAQSAVLRQKREEDLVPIYPRTAAELVSVAVEGIEATDVAGALSEIVDDVNAASSDAANAQSAAETAQSAAEAAQATADEALTKAEAGGGEAGEVAYEVEQLKETVEAQAETINSLTAQIEALQEALDGYMPISGDQFTGAYYGTTVAADDGEIDLTKGSIYTAAVSGDTFEVNISGAVGASCFTLVLTCEEACGVAWPASVQWPDGEAPDIVAGVNVITFISPDAGTTWYGTVNGTSFAAEA